MKAHKDWGRNIQTEICAFVGVTICKKEQMYNQGGILTNVLKEMTQRTVVEHDRRDGYKSSLGLLWASETVVKT